MTKLNICFLLIIGCLINTCDKDFQLAKGMEETFYVRNAGADMPVFVRGNGLSNKMVILLHGGPGDTSVAYMKNVAFQQLHEHYAFAYWDQRQQGNAHGHFDKESVNLELIVEDLHQVVQSLKLRYGDDLELYLMGHSWGGAVGTAYLQTADYQEDIAGFIEMNGGYDFPKINEEVIKMLDNYGSQEIAAGNNISAWQEILDYSNQLNPSMMSVDETLELNSFASQIRNAELLPDFYKIPSISGFEEGSQAVSNDVTVTANAIAIFTQRTLIEALFQMSLTEDLHKITVPTLLIWGKYDFKVPPALGELALQELGSADKTLLIYEHCGHSPMSFDPDLLVSDIIDFLE